MASTRRGPEIQEAIIAIQEARDSLRAAEKELRNWKRDNEPIDTLHPVYVELKAEVTRRTTIFTRAQATYDDTISNYNNTSNLSNPTDGRMTLHESNLIQDCLNQRY